MIKEALHRSGRWMERFSYALLAEEWYPNLTHGSDSRARRMRTFARHWARRA